MIKRLFEKLKLVKPRQPHLPQTNVRRMLNFERLIDERIAILEMLLWKHHIKGIPKDVFNRLVENGFLEKSSSGGYIWTELSKEIAKEFNSKFNYA